MAITRIQTTQAGYESGVQTSIVTPNFGSSVTVGNLLIVAARIGLNIAVGSITDTLGTSYAKAIAQVGSLDPNLEIWYGLAVSSGTNAVTVNYALSDYCWVFAIEVNSTTGWLSPILDVTEGKTGTGVTDLVSDAISTVHESEYMVLAAGQTNFAAYTAGANYTIVDGTIPTSPNDFGGVAERILTTGLLSSQVQHITSTVSDEYVLCVASFKARMGVGPVLRGGELLHGSLLRGGRMVA